MFTCAAHQGETANCQVAVAALSGNVMRKLALKVSVELAVAVAVAVEKGSGVRGQA